MRIREGTKANFPFLAVDEIGYVTDTGELLIGTVTGNQPYLTTRYELNQHVANLTREVGFGQSTSYRVELVSSNGVAFRNGIVDTTLRAYVYQGPTDVTDTLNAARFRWKRVSDDPEGDLMWNASHFGGTKSVNITTADVNVRATFFCEILEES